MERSLQLLDVAVAAVNVQLDNGADVIEVFDVSGHGPSAVQLPIHGAEPSRRRLSG
jgi:uroporphyrinogen-III decarboxylase